MQRGQPRHHFQIKCKLSYLQEYEAHAEEKVWAVTLATEGRGTLSPADRYMLNMAFVN